MTAPDLVGLIGRKRAGKDTYARGLIEEGFERFAFADPLKEALLATDPHVMGPRSFNSYRLSSVVGAYGWEDAKEWPEVRRLLQNFGVGIRAIDPDFWVRATLGRTLAAPRAVLTDVRFPNEVEAVKDAGGVIVRICRPGLDTSDTHVSETALDDYPADLVVWNTGSPEALAASARTLARVGI